MEHPGAFLPAAKEVHFFSRNYAQGSDWYMRHFEARRPGQCSGEISPSYLYDAHSPRRIFEWNPNVKLFVCLRNPVERAESAYRYAVTHGYGLEVETLKEVFERRPEYLHHGLYSRQMSRYFDWFPRGRILVTIYDDIGKDPVAFMRRIYQFLGLAEDFRPTFVDKKVNVSTGAPRFKWLDRAIRGAAERARRAGFERAVWRIAQSGVREILERVNRRDPTFPTATDSERDELAALFKEDVQELGNLIGRDLLGEWFGLSSERDVFVSATGTLRQSPS